MVGSKSHQSKKQWNKSFVVCKKHWFIVVRGELRTTSKMVLFAKIVDSLESLTVLTRSFIFRSVRWWWMCLAYFFRFTFIIDLFFLLIFLNTNGTSTLHTNVYLTTGIPQQCLSCCLNVLVNFGQIFALFLSTFIVDFEYYLFIVNAALWHIFVENQKGFIFMGVVAKHQLQR